MLAVVAALAQMLLFRELIAALGHKALDSEGEAQASDWCLRRGGHFLLADLGTTVLQDARQAAKILAPLIVVVVKERLVVGGHGARCRCTRTLPLQVIRHGSDATRRCL